MFVICNNRVCTRNSREFPTQKLPICRDCKKEHVPRACRIRAQVFPRFANIGSLSFQSPKRPAIRRYCTIVPCLRLRFIVGEEISAGNLCIYQAVYFRAADFCRIIRKRLKIILWKWITLQCAVNRGRRRRFKHCKIFGARFGLFTCGPSQVPAGVVFGKLCASLLRNGSYRSVHRDTCKND